MKIGILALQGAFREHYEALCRIGAEPFCIRRRKDLCADIGGIVLPGGESTVQRKLLHSTGLYAPICALVNGGTAVLGTCAGLILLSQRIAGEDAETFGALPIEVQRNGYGRQLGSFAADVRFEGIGVVPGTFIRAPRVSSCGRGVTVYARHEKDAVAVGAGRILALSFHPEVAGDDRIHAFFCKMASER